MLRRSAVFDHVELTCGTRCLLGEKSARPPRLRRLLGTSQNTTVTRFDIEDVTAFLSLHRKGLASLLQAALTDLVVNRGRYRVRRDLGPGLKTAPAGPNGVCPRSGY